MAAGSRIAPLAPILIVIAAGVSSCPALGQFFSVEAGKCADGEFMGLDLALEYCDRAIASGKLSGKELAVTHYDRAVSWSRKKELFRALTDLNESIRIDPTYASAFKARGGIHLSRKEYVQACADLDEAIRIEPRFSEAFVLRGHAWLARGDADRAILDFDQTLRSGATIDAGAYTGAGIAYSGRRRNFDPSAMHAAAFLERSAAYLLKGDAERSKADLDEWVRLNPKFGERAYYARAAMWLDLDVFDLAIADFSRAIIQSPSDRVSLSSRGLAAMLKSDLTEAIADFSTAIRLNPNDWAPLRLRGYARFFSGEFETAAEDLSEAGRLNPADPFIMAWLFLARARASPADLTKFRAELADRSARLKKRPWPYPVIALLLGTAKPDEVLAAIKTADDKLKREQTCEANYFTAQWFLLSGQQQKASELLRLAGEHCPPRYFEHAGALAELSRLPR